MLLYPSSSLLVYYNARGMMQNLLPVTLIRTFISYIVPILHIYLVAKSCFVSLIRFSFIPLKIKSSMSLVTYYILKCYSTHRLLYHLWYQMVAKNPSLLLYNIPRLLFPTDAHLHREQGSGGGRRNRLAAGL